MPEPKGSENKKEFIGRCVSVLADEGKYTDNKQRVAICFSKWERKDKKKKLSEKIRFKYLTEKEIFYIEKGLTREEARKKTIGKIKSDHRGFDYDPVTGKCVYL